MCQMCDTDWPDLYITAVHFLFCWFFWRNYCGQWWLAISAKYPTTATQTPLQPLWQWMAIGLPHDHHWSNAMDPPTPILCSCTVLAGSSQLFSTLDSYWPSSRLIISFRKSIERVLSFRLWIIALQFAHSGTNSVTGSTFLGWSNSDTGFIWCICI